MPPTWANVYPNPDALELAATLPGEEEAVQYRGLELVPVYDVETQLVWYDWWELRHQRTGAVVMYIRAEGREAAMERATQVAERALWESFEHKSDWNGPLISPELRAFIRDNGETYHAPNSPEPCCTLEDLGIAFSPRIEEQGDLDGLVPYRQVP